MAIYTYARFSTDRQDEASIVDQQRSCQEFAARHLWQIAAEFTDEGISGAALGNRPGVLRLLAALASGDILLLADLTRLCRSQDLAPLLERLRFRGVRVLGVLDGFDINSPHARMQAGLSGLMSDEMRSQLRVRTHLALETRAKTSRPTGGRAYGFDNGGTPLDAEAAVVKEAFERYAAGATMKSIVADFNVRGIASPGASWSRKSRRSDGRWLLSALHEMLHNERYMGQVIWNRSTWVKDPDSGRRIRRLRPRSEWIIRTGPAIIDEITWKRAQARLQERANSYAGGRGGHAGYLLSGLLLCARCGGRMVICGRKGSHYYCGTRRLGGAMACSMGLGVRRTIAEQVLLEPIRQQLLAPPAVARACELIRELHSAASRHLPTELEPECQKLNAKIGRYQSMMEADPECAEDLRSVVERLHDEIAALRRRSWRVAASRRFETDLPAERAYRQQVEGMAQLLDRQQTAAARSILKEVVGDIPVRPDETGKVLVADVRIDAAPLFRAAGVVRIGSGGRI